MVANFASFETAFSVLETRDVAVPYKPHIITPAIASAIAHDRFEAEEAEELPNILEHGDRVLEIGAGIGFISTLLARDMRVQQVLAYEANPRLMDYMAALHRLNGVEKVKRRNAILTNEPVDEMTFYLREDFWMGSLEPRPNPFVETVGVPTQSLDEILAQEMITLIVCDIEGAECFLFEDAKFADVTRVYLELHDHITGLSGVSRLFEAMARHGFAYDPRHSSKSIVLFRKVSKNEILRPYSG